MNSHENEKYCNDLGKAIEQIDSDEFIDKYLVDEQFEIYRLVVGPYETEKIAEDKAEQLNEIGFPCFVVEAQ